MSDEPKDNNPRCAGIILDGNRRWARERGLAPIEGHTEGYKRVKELVKWTKDTSLTHLILFAFSTENWNRSKEEVDHLMYLIEDRLLEDTEELSKEGVRLRFIGERERFSETIQRKLVEAEEETKNIGPRTLAFALSYGGRSELTHVFNRLLEEERRGAITEEDISAHLWTYDMPDPDLIIRTSGEQRLSGFLTWQSVYSELFFTKTYWPDFSKEEFYSILREYESRERRRGK